MASEKEDGIREPEPVTTAHRTLSDLVYARLHRQIITDALPPGHRLVEEQIAKALGVSRNPVREAIRALEAEGFVEIIPRRGAIVSSPSESEIEQLFAVRANLGALAGRLAAKHGTLHEVEELSRIVAKSEKALARGDHDQVVDLNVEFHDLVLRMGRNQILLDIMTPLHGRMRRIFSATFSQGRAEASLQEHRDLVDAIAAGDEQRAAGLGQAHVETAQRWRDETDDE